MAYADPEVQRAAEVNLRKQRKAKIQAVLSDIKVASGCVLCGTRDDLAYHHREPSRKTIDLSRVATWLTTGN